MNQSVSQSSINSKDDAVAMTYVDTLGIEIIPVNRAEEWMRLDRLTTKASFGITIQELCIARACATERERDTEHVNNLER
jgi:hypothetical protein